MITEVSIAKFCEVISELFGVQERQAKGILSNRRLRVGLVQKIGQNGSVVWITFKPELSGVLPIETTIEELWGKNLRECKGVRCFEI
jgi:hypothetical protein